MKLQYLFPAVLAAAVAAGCGGGGGSTTPPAPTPTPAATPTPAPTATPTAGPGLNLTPASLSFDNLTSPANKAATASASGYSGAFTLSAGSPSCAGIATFSISGGTITVTPVAAGTGVPCNETVSAVGLPSKTLSVTVTTTALTGQSANRSIGGR